MHSPLGQQAHEPLTEWQIRPISPGRQTGDNGGSEALMRRRGRRNGSRFIVLAATLSGCQVGHSCKAIGLQPVVLIEVPAAWADGTSTFRVCADDACSEPLTPQRSAVTTLTFPTPLSENGRSVRVSVVGLGAVIVSAESTVRTHAGYPGCQDTPVAAAKFDPATRTLVQSNWTWDRA